MLLEPLNTIFTTCTAAITTEEFEFRYAKLWELNILDGRPKPEVLWGLPIKSIDRFKKGTKTSTVTTELFFVKNNNPANTQAENTILVDEMHDAWLEFKDAFEASSIQPDILSVHITDIYNWFNETRAGIYVILEFEFANANC